MTSQEPSSHASPVPEEAAARAAADRKAIQGGAGWFFWIGGLSLVNSAALLLGIDVVFFLGLGVSLLCEVFGLMLAAEIPAAALVLRGMCSLLAIAAAALFLFFGWQARKGRGWAFVAGMAVYTGDALVVALMQDWVGLAFHAFALFAVYGGHSALRRERARSAAAAPAALAEAA